MTCDAAHVGHVDQCDAAGSWRGQVMDGSFDCLECDNRRVVFFEISGLDSVLVCHGWLVSVTGRELPGIGIVSRSIFRFFHPKA